MNNKRLKISDQYSVQVISSLDEFNEMKDTWNSLVQSNGSFIPWLIWEWFNLFLKYFLKKDALFIVAVCSFDKIVAIAPFMIVETNYKGLLKTKKVQFIGNVHSPICNFIFGYSDFESKRGIVNSIFSFFLDHYRNWDIIELEMIPVEHSIFNLVADVMSDYGLKNRYYSCNGDWYLDEINYTYDEYFQNLRRKHRRDIQRCQKHLQKLGTLTCDIKFDSDNLDYYLDLYSHVREKSWKAKEKDSSFLRDVTKLFAERGWLRMAFLSSNGETIACEKWIVYKTIGFAWDSVFDEKYQKYSPGKIVASEITKYVMDQDKVNEIDLGQGDQDYKKDWTPKRRERKGITVFNNNKKGKIYAYLMTKILPAMEETPYLFTIKNKISRYLKQRNDR